MEGVPYQRESMLFDLTFFEHHLTDGCGCQSKDFLLDVRADGKRVRSCAGGTKASGLKLNRSILEGKIEDLGLNFLRSEGTKVRSPVKRCEVIGGASPSGQLTCRLWKIDKVFTSQSCRPWIVDGDKINEVH